MIVADTPVWVAALRNRDGIEARTLRRLLDADDVGLPVPVRLELLSGASRTDRPRLRRAFSALPVLYPTDETWLTLDDWTERAAAAGQRFGFGDLLIGVLAAENGALIWALDDDFARMERVGLVQVYEPPA